MDLGELLQAIHKYITISYTSWLSSGKKVQSSICDMFYITCSLIPASHNPSTNEQLDGIDLDFEGIQTLDEWRAYLDFIIKVSSYLHRNKLLLTVALHPGQYLPTEVCESVDRVHVMTYNMMSNFGQGHHASLQSVKDVLLSFVDKGCPPSKLTLGVPAYARHETSMGRVKMYSEVIDDYIAEDNGEGTSNLRSMNSFKGYRFDSPDDVQTKVSFAMQQSLGGVFIWELGQDKQLMGVAEGGVLLEAAAGVDDAAGISFKSEEL